jgi:hypothetical protein
MRLLSYLIISFLLLGAIAGAGCTAGGRPIPVTSPTPAAAQDLSSLVLTPVDVPQGFTRTVMTAKKTSDMGTLARSFGWEEGNLAEFRHPGTDPGIATIILQTIAVYPAGNVPAIADIVNKQDRADNNFSYADLAVPDLGNHSFAFSGRSRVTLLAPEGDNQTPGVGSSNPEIAVTTNTSFVEIIIAKDTVFEVLRMTGPDTSAETLSGIAVRAYAKIP